MNTQTLPPDFIKLLAHDLRWQMLKALTVGDYRVQELTALVHEPMNLVSYHLKKLRDDGLVSSRRSEADGRDVYYSLDLDKLRDLYRGAGAALHPALGEINPVHPEMLTVPPTRVLFVCTHNSARSQMAEGWMRHVGGGHVQAYSAGSHPTRLHPNAIAAMDQFGVDIRGQESKNLRDFEGQSFDYVVTVCDRAREVCPTFPDGGQYIHWGFPDPADIPEAQARRQAFEQTAARLKSRIDYFLTSLTEKQT